MEKETDLRPERCKLVSQLHDEYTDCMNSLEVALIERFLFDESKTIEERRQYCSMLCEILAVIAAAFNLNTVVKASGIRKQMYEYFNL